MLLWFVMMGLLGLVKVKGVPLATVQEGCPFRTVEFNLEGKQQCMPCIKCDPGFGLSHQCNNHQPYVKLTMVKCVPCADGYFSKYGYKCEKCRKCSELNQITTGSCNATKNRECGCRKGLYPHPATSICNQSCSPCFRNRPEHRVEGHECLGMPENKRCKEGFDTVIKINTPSLPHITTHIATPTNQQNNTYNGTDLTTGKPRVTKKEKKSYSGVWKACVGIIIVMIAILALYCWRRKILAYVVRSRPKLSPASSLSTTATFGGEVTLNENMEQKQVLLPSECRGMSQSMDDQSREPSIYSQESLNVQSKDLDLSISEDEHWFTVKVDVSNCFENHPEKIKHRAIFCRIVFGCKSSSFINHIESFNDVIVHLETKKPELTYRELTETITHCKKAKYNRRPYLGDEWFEIKHPLTLAARCL